MDRLGDTERKLLRILAAGRSGRFPPLPTLQLRAGRSQAEVLRALIELARRGFIEWRPGWHERGRVLREREAELARPERDAPHWMYESF